MNFDWGVIWQYRGPLLEGTLLTILLTVLTMLIAVPAGVALALMRLSKSKVFSVASASFVEFFRNLPLILVIYWAFYVMPVAIGVEFSAFTTGLAALPRPPIRSRNLNIASKHASRTLHDVKSPALTRCA